MYRDPYLVELGARLQAVRKSKKISVRKLGELCEIHYTAISFIETGRASAKITTLKTIADKLGFDLKEII